MDLQGYEPYVASAPHVITSRDKLVRMDPTGEETVINILLTRKKDLICREQGGTKKFELLFTTWTQEDPRFPLLYNGATYRLFVPVGSGVQAPTVKRVKPAKGESKLDKCRAIFVQHKDAPKADVVKLFIEQAGCTAGGANTYYLTCKKGA